MIIKEVKITKADENGNKEQVKVMLGYCFATEISYKILADEDIHDFMPEAILCLKNKKMPDTRKTLYLILAAMQAYYERLGQKPPLTDMDLMCDMTQQELATALGTIIGMHIEMSAIPPGDETEKGEKDSDQKNV